MNDNYICNTLPDPKDDRDYIFTADASEYNKLPIQVDLREHAASP